MSRSSEGAAAGAEPVCAPATASQGAGWSRRTNASVREERTRKAAGAPAEVAGAAAGRVIQTGRAMLVRPWPCWESPDPSHRPAPEENVLGTRSFGKREPLPDGGA